MGTTTVTLAAGGALASDINYWPSGSDTPPSGSNTIAGLIALRNTNLLITTGRQNYDVYLNSATILLNTFMTASNLNSRSPAPLTKGYFNSGGSNIQEVIMASRAGFNNSNWIATPKTIPVCVDSNNDNILCNCFNNTLQASFDEDVQTRKFSRNRNTRRPTRKGYWPLLGNNGINKMTITGGGAFSSIYPVFHNDTIWVNEYDWRNASNRGGASWNANILGILLRRQAAIF